jgi:alkyl sulfatase BDS1-like metallo-beta-lactamase superfamily hydrolase
LRDAGELALASHLIEYAVITAPGSSQAHALRAEIYAARAAAESSSMARNILNHAAIASRDGKRDFAGDM